MHAALCPPPPPRNDAPLLPVPTFTLHIRSLTSSLHAAFALPLRRSSQTVSLCRTLSGQRPHAPRSVPQRCRSSGSRLPCRSQAHFPIMSPRQTRTSPVWQRVNGHPETWMHDAPEVSCAEAHVAVPPATLSRPSANHTPPEGWRRLRARRAPTLRRAGTRDVGGNVFLLASPTGWYFRLPILMASDGSMRSGREGSGSTPDGRRGCELRATRPCMSGRARGKRTHARI